jgi:hypothetical protein
MEATSLICEIYICQQEIFETQRKDYPTLPPAKAVGNMCRDAGYHPADCDKKWETPKCHLRKVVHAQA